MDQSGIVIAGGDIQAWRPVHGGQMQDIGNGGLSFSDSPRRDYQMIRAQDPRLQGATLRLTCRFAPTEDCASEFYVNHWGGMDVCRMSAAGQVLDAGMTSALWVHRDPATGEIQLAIEFFNTHSSVSLGTTRGPHGQYHGDGKPQFVFHRLQVERLPDMPMERRIRLVDVGAAYGLHMEWRRDGGRIIPICFEPNPASAAGIRSDITGFPGGVLLETGLLDIDGPRVLQVTRHPGCSSVLEPNFAVLDRYEVAPLFDVMKRIEVNCRRYDSLHAEGLVPTADVVKVDVQGAEYQVLQGFGALLDQVLAVELEAHLYPIYVGQKLLGDIAGLLDAHGLGLRKMEPQYSFDGELVEFNLFFTRRLSSVAEDDAITREKLAHIERLWQLSVHNGGRLLAETTLAQTGGGRR